MDNEDIENEDNFQEDAVGAQSNQADISEREANGLSEEEQEPKNEPIANNETLAVQLFIEQANSNMSNASNPPAKKCMNEMCPSGNQREVVKVEKGMCGCHVGAYQYLCQTCFKQYKDNHFCYYCKQIYFGEDDGECWIECDKCNKWTHADCEASKGDYKNIKEQMNQAAQFPFECPNCRPKLRYEKRSTSQALAKEKLKHKRNDMILNSYGFFWKLRPEEINSDLQRMRNM